MRQLITFYDCDGIGMVMGAPIEKVVQFDDLKHTLEFDQDAWTSFQKAKLMKCARLHLQQRAKSKTKREKSTAAEKPRRYCQKRLVNPQHEEDPRWIDIFDRYHCNVNSTVLTDALDSTRAQQDTGDMVLTVQTLMFTGDVDKSIRPRTSFKYKKHTDGNKHRMFVKQAVSDDETDDDRASQLTYYYFDEYIKYLYNTDRSRPASRTSSLFLRGCSKEKDKKEDNKLIQIQMNTDETKKSQKNKSNLKNNGIKIPKTQIRDEIRDVSETIENTKITYQKSGKRKSLTISRAQSPETVQVIRVDVVCNYTNSSSSDYEDKRDSHIDRSESFRENAITKKDVYATRYGNHLASKYLLTKSIKSVDENLSGGSKVTLLCKTFKLSDRNIPEKPEKEKKNKTLKKKTHKKSNKIKHHEIVF